MTSTIQLSDLTKQKLFHYKLDLEKEKGKSISYNDIIEILLKTPQKSQERRENLHNFKKYSGFLKKEALEIYYGEKRKDLEREEEKAPLITKE